MKERFPFTAWSRKMVLQDVILQVQNVSNCFPRSKPWEPIWCYLQRFVRDTVVGR